jgi:hypothetical protein
MEYRRVLRKNQVSLALEYESEQFKDDLGEEFQRRFRPNIPVESMLNRY